MSIVISESDYTQLWQRDRRQIESESEGISETIDVCPQEFGRGYEQWIDLPEIKLLIIDLQFDENIAIECPATTPESCVEFGFNILGSWNQHGEGTNFLDSVVEQAYDGGVYQVSKGERLLKVDIHLEPSQLFNNFIADGLELFPSELQQVVTGENSHFYGEICANNSAMKLALTQILNCPFTGVTKKLYLESKCLELIALKLDQLTKDTSKTSSENILKADDIVRIHQASNILIDRLQHPPSLSELSRQVGLNDRKLKQGFQQVFGTTVFGYLHEYRMTMAMKSLIQGNTSIDRVIRSVGYASRSSFSRAFKQRFGASPRNYLG